MSQEHSPSDPPYSIGGSRLNEDGRVMVARRAHAQQAESARVAELEQPQAVEVVGNHVEADVTLPFAAPPGAALNF